MRLTRHALSCAAIFSSALLATPAFAAPSAPPSTAAKAQDTVNPLMASVGGQKIYLNDVRRALQSLPPAARQLPLNTVVGLVMGQLISQKAVLIQAEKEKFQNQPNVKQQMADAADNALLGAYLSSKVMPKVTDAAVEQQYKKEYASKKGELEIHARHILVATKAEAEEIIKKLQHGANFADLAKKLSTDKGSGASGGDLGWFKKGDMLPAFSEAAFKMKPGSVSQTPVKTQYGYHVIQVLGSRAAKIPSLDQVKAQVRQDLIRADVQKLIADAEAKVKIERFELRAPDSNKGGATQTTPAPKK